MLVLQTWLLVWISVLMMARHGWKSSSCRSRGLLATRDLLGASTTASRTTIWPTWLPLNLYPRAVDMDGFAPLAYFSSTRTLGVSTLYDPVLAPGGEPRADKLTRQSWAVIMAHYSLHSSRSRLRTSSSAWWEDCPSHKPSSSRPLLQRCANTLAPTQRYSSAQSSYSYLSLRLPLPLGSGTCS